MLKAADEAFEMVVLVFEEEGREELFNGERLVGERSERFVILESEE